MIMVVTAILLGALAGHFFIPQSFIPRLDIILTIALDMLILSVGIDIGLNRQVFQDLRRLGIKILIIPICTIIGSILGGIISSFICGMPVNIGMAISSGFGWYSLSATILTDICGAEIGAVAFLSNVFREAVSFMVIPLIAKYLNYYSTMSSAGATSMDTTLPVIAENTNEEIAVISFVHGIVLTMVVPVLVPLLYNLNL